MEIADLQRRWRRIAVGLALVLVAVAFVPVALTAVAWFALALVLLVALVEVARRRRGSPAGPSLIWALGLCALTVAVLMMLGALPLGADAFEGTRLGGVPGPVRLLLGAFALWMVVLAAALWLLHPAWTRELLAHEGRGRSGK